jgi:hypothetical protein
MTRKIFVNYRRTDNPDFVERIRDWFIQRYGRDNVFMDFDTIPPFTHFSDFIREKVRECDVLVAIIGPRWMETLRERIADGREDFVRVEIQLALEEGKLIAPICIKGALIPPKEDLPHDLRPILDYNAAFLDSGRNFLDKVERIMNAVEQELTRREGQSNFAVEIVDAPGFNLVDEIELLHEAMDNQQWTVALELLKRIRKSGYVPKFYPLDEYETEIQTAIKLQEIERDYAIIRLMAQRVQRKGENPARVWAALQAFWQMHPGYDPDDLVSQFQPQILPLAEPTPAPEAPVADDIDPRIFEQITTFADSLLEEFFDLDKLAELARDNRHSNITFTREEAEKLGIIKQD